jgi:hypothetical protein
MIADYFKKGQSHAVFRLGDLESVEKLHPSPFFVENWH